MATILAAEAVEGGEAGAAIQGSNALQATTQGINLMKNVISSGLSIYSTVDGLLSTIDKKDEITKAFKDKWHSLGLVIPSIDVPQNMNGVFLKRQNLVSSGIIPKEFSAEKIIDLIKNGKLPTGWDDAIAINQGFGPYIQNRDRLNALKNKDFIKESQEKLNLETKKNFSYFDEQNKDREAKRIAAGFRLY